MTDLIARARAYVGKMPPAVAGQHGHDATFKVAITLVHGFGLSEGDAMPIIAEYSSRCSPPWSQKELQHKLSSAAQHARSCKPRGHLRAARYRFAPEESPPRDRSKKKISLCLTTSASTEAGHPVEEKTANPATEPGVDLADLGTSDPSTHNTTAPGIPHPADQDEGAAGIPGWTTAGLHRRHKLPACVTREAAALFSRAIEEARVRVHANPVALGEGTANWPGTGGNPQDGSNPRPRQHARLCCPPTFHAQGAIRGDYL